MSPSEIPDFPLADCVEAIRRGSSEWENSFFLYFQPRIRTYASRALQSSPAVDDVVQDTLWAAIKALRQGRLQEPAHLPSFVYSIARNRVMDVHRGQARARTQPLLDQFDCAALTDCSASDEERERLASAAIEQLEPVDRQILTMLLVNGLKYPEVAGRLKVSLATVRQRKCRALRRITERLSQTLAFKRP